MRTNKRESTAIRPIKITPGVIENADGSCMIEIGKTRVICTASQNIPHALCDECGLSERCWKALATQTARLGGLGTAPSNKKEKGEKEIVL